MKYRTCLTTLLYSFLLGLILPASAQNSLQHQKDSLRHALEHAEGIDKLQTYNKLYYIYMAEAGDDQKMDTLMTLFEQAEAEAIRQGDTQMQGMVYGNRIISYINRSEHDKVIEKAPAYLDFYIRHDLWKFYYQIHMQLITAYNLKGDYELAAAEAGKCIPVPGSARTRQEWQPRSMPPASSITCRGGRKRKKTASGRASACCGKFPVTIIS